MVYGKDLGTQGKGMLLGNCQIKKGIVFSWIVGRARDPLCPSFFPFFPTTIILKCRYYNALIGDNIILFGVTWYSNLICPAKEPF